ncbi:MAG: DUF3090 domain-containing protein [Anaerolineae bacterium]|nr:MAG: DUF3090 domain-containing protein [Anaerolineae bacterium]
MMSPIRIELNPVDHITADALGPPGQRVFYLQGRKGDQVVTLIAEKFQIHSLAVGIERFLAEIAQRFPTLYPPSSAYDEEAMRIQPPVDPLFRISNIGLGYSQEDDLILMVIHELLPEASIEELFEAEPPEDEGEAGVVRFWCTRSQLLALSRWSMEVVARGRPICPQCGEPIDPEGHFCVKKNGGHRRA